jgi:Xanthine/uracil permeases
VLGGTGIAMFGMVAATGIRILSEVDYKTNRNNLLIVALGIGFGMIPLVAPQFFIHFPKVLEPMLHSGILLTAVVAFVLNLYFNGSGALECRRSARHGTRRRRRRPAALTACHPYQKQAAFGPRPCEVFFVSWGLRRKPHARVDAVASSSPATGGTA